MLKTQEIIQVLILALLGIGALTVIYQVSSFILANITWLGPLAIALAAAAGGVYAYNRNQR
jgi:hypothetical protein